MSKEYRYRKHIHWGQYVIPIVFSLICLLLLGLSVYLGFQLRNIFVAGIMVIIAFIVFIEGGVSWYLYYRLAGTSVSVTDDDLIYKNRKTEKRYPLESISLEFSSIKYTGGWVKIKTGKDTIRLTVVLEDLSGFLQELKTKLDHKQLSSHYDAHQLFGFIKTAVAADQSWERVYSLFGKIFLLMLDIGIAIFIGFTFGTIPTYGSLLSLIWVGFSMLWTGTAYTITEIILMRPIAKQSDEDAFTFPPRDLSYEKLVLDRTFIWGSIAYILLSFLLILTLGILRYV